MAKRRRRVKPRPRAIAPADEELAEPEHAEPEHAEPERAEPEHADPENTEPEHADPRSPPELARSPDGPTTGGLEQVMAPNDAELESRIRSMSNTLLIYEETIRVLRTNGDDLREKVERLTQEKEMLEAVAHDEGKRKDARHQEELESLRREFEELVEEDERRWDKLMVAVEQVTELEKEKKSEMVEADDRSRRCTVQQQHGEAQRLQREYNALELENKRQRTGLSAALEQIAQLEREQDEANQKAEADEQSRQRDLQQQQEEVERIRQEYRISEMQHERQVTELTVALEEVTQKGKEKAHADEQLRQSTVQQLQDEIERLRQECGALVLDSKHRQTELTAALQHVEQLDKEKELAGVLRRDYDTLKLVNTRQQTELTAIQQRIVQQEKQLADAKVRAKQSDVQHQEEAERLRRDYQMFKLELESKRQREVDGRVQEALQQAEVNKSRYELEKRKHGEILRVLNAKNAENSEKDSRIEALRHERTQIQQEAQRQVDALSGSLAKSDLRLDQSLYHLRANLTIAKNAQIDLVYAQHSLSAAQEESDEYIFANIRALAKKASGNAKSELATLTSRYRILEQHLLDVCVDRDARMEAWYAFPHVLAEAYEIEQARFQTQLAQAEFKATRPKYNCFVDATFSDKPSLRAKLFSIYDDDVDQWVEIRIDGGVLARPFVVPKDRMRVDEDDTQHSLDGRLDEGRREPDVIMLSDRPWVLSSIEHTPEWLESRRVRPVERHDLFKLPMPREEEGWEGWKEREEDKGKGAEYDWHNQQLKHNRQPEDHQQPAGNASPIPASLTQASRKDSGMITPRSPVDSESRDTNRLKRLASPDTTDESRPSKRSAVCDPLLRDAPKQPRKYVAPCERRMGRSLRAERPAERARSRDARWQHGIYTPGQAATRNRRRVP